MIKKTIVFAVAVVLSSASIAYAAEGVGQGGPAQGANSGLVGGSSGPATATESATTGRSDSSSKAVSGDSNAGKQPTATSEQHEKLGN